MILKLKYEIVSGSLIAWKMKIKLINNSKPIIKIRIKKPHFYIYYSIANDGLYVKIRIKQYIISKNWIDKGEIGFYGKDEYH